MDYLNFVVDLARAAGDVLTHYRDRDKHVELKGRANLVTAADRESEALIVGEIRQRFPDHAILAEESGELPACRTGADRARWIIDPLDGTTNYAHGFPVYSVSIALELDGVVECGAVFDPARREMFCAARGHGAWLDGERLSVSRVRTLADSLLLTGFPYGFRTGLRETLDLFEAFLVSSQAVRRAGSAALDLCYVASGRADGFWELDLNPWDTAAGIVILGEAGGMVSDFHGGRFDIAGRAILASNGSIHREMIDLISAPKA